MDLLKTADIEKLGIKDAGGATLALFEKMITWGWVDGIGRSRDWQFWNRSK